MPAYVIAEVEIDNPEGYKGYTDHTPDSIKAFGGRFIVRGGTADAKEGPTPSRIVVIEFPDMESAQGWYHSDRYQALIPIRQANAHGRLFIVEGVEP